MTHHLPQQTPSPRAGHLVAGTVSVVVAAVLIIAGAFALWGESKKDADGYLSTGTERFATTGSALASERLDVEIDGKHWLAGVEDLGDTRLKVAPDTGKPVFAGVGKTDDVTEYLAGVEHTVVEDFDTDPFSARHRELHGARAPAPPAEQDIWAAQIDGAGPQTLEWRPDDGDWSVVVMNADGSRGVVADVSAGAEVAFLEPLGWALSGAGLALLLAGAALIVRGVRPRPRRPRVAAPLAA